MSDISDQVEADALKPQSMSSDGQTVVKRSLTELIEADKYTRANTAAASPAAMFRSMNCKIVPPGGH